MAFESLTKRLDDIFSRLRGRARLSPEDVDAALKEVKYALLEADVHFKVVKTFINDVRTRADREEVYESLTPGQTVIRIVRDELTKLMGEETELLLKPAGQVNVIMLTGLQGAGKTTTAAKLGGIFKSQGRRVLLAAGDTQRPAAIEQLRTNSVKLSLDVFEMGTKYSPVEIARRAYEKAVDEKFNVLIIDTAGRLHIDDALMLELSDIKRFVPVDYTLLVIDAMTGQDAVRVAADFRDKVGVDGLIATKLDGDMRGGAVLSVRAVTGVPIYFLGMGEKLDELQPFHPDRMASRILGMGDILSLIESAEKNADAAKQRQAAENIRKAQFTYDDFLTQIRQIEGMGGVGSVLSMLPGIKGFDAGSVDEGQFKRIESIILSMTPEERMNPKLMNPSRKKRIAKGSGRDISEVNRMVKQFEEMQKVMKQFSGMKKHGRMFGRNLFGKSSFY